MAKKLEDYKVSQLQGMLVQLKKKVDKYNVERVKEGVLGDIASMLYRTYSKQLDEVERALKEKSK